MEIVLVAPEIPQNTGSIGRLCVATGSPLHLVDPLGFVVDDKHVRRAGLDYWEHVPLRVWPSWAAFEAELPSLGTPYFFSTKAARALWDAPLGSHDAGVVLVFGRETAGLPPELHERFHDAMVGMPIVSPHVRSLNLSTCVGIAVYEVLRQRARGARGVRPGSDRGQTGVKPGSDRGLTPV